MLAIVLLSHAGDGAAEVTWPRRDVDIESTIEKWCTSIGLLTTDENYETSVGQSQPTEVTLTSIGLSGQWKLR
jgi:hypothetical protein